jgi:chorismate mutase/prephenate dehydratase
MDDRYRLHNRIDDLDAQILDALNERMSLARDIGEVKRTEGSPMLDLRREEEVVSRLESLNGGPLPSESLRAIYSEIISASRRMQKPLSIAFLGPDGTFSHLAALDKFGHGADMTPLRTIHDVFTEVEKGNCDLGVVPIENSTGGAVNDTLDILASTPLKICGESYLHISHDLASLSGMREKIRKIYSHPQAFSQCRKWLAANLGGIPVVETASTASAAKKAAIEQESAAIVSSSASILYGLKVVDGKIEDNAGNSTHFFVIGKVQPGPTGHDTTSILLALEDVPGALYKTLKPLYDAGVNMTRIVSIPAVHRGWRYMFFIDLDGHRETPQVAAVISEIQRITAWCNVLGSYPKSPENI